LQGDQPDQNVKRRGGPARRRKARYESAQAQLAYFEDHEPDQLVSLPTARSLPVTMPAGGGRHHYRVNGSRPDRGPGSCFSGRSEISEGRQFRRFIPATVALPIPGKVTNRQSGPRSTSTTV